VDWSSSAVIASVSGNTICRSCFRIFVLTCCTQSTIVLWRLPPSAAIVTQLVTQLTIPAEGWLPLALRPAPCRSVLRPRFVDVRRYAGDSGSQSSQKRAATPCANGEPPLPQDPSCRKAGLDHERAHGETVM
jgi:hypothetical protein